MPLLAALVCAQESSSRSSAKYIEIAEALLYAATERTELPVRMASALLLHHLLKAVHASHHEALLARLGLWDLDTREPTSLAVPFLNRALLIDSFTPLVLETAPGFEGEVLSDVGQRGYSRIDQAYLLHLDGWDGK